MKIVRNVNVYSSDVIIGCWSVKTSGSGLVVFLNRSCTVVVSDVSGLTFVIFCSGVGRSVMGTKMFERNIVGKMIVIVILLVLLGLCTSRLRKMSVYVMVNVISSSRLNAPVVFSMFLCGV